MVWSFSLNSDSAVQSYCLLNRLPIYIEKLAYSAFIPLSHFDSVKFSSANTNVARLYLYLPGKTGCYLELSCSRDTVLSHLLQKNSIRCSIELIYINQYELELREAISTHKNSNVLLELLYKVDKLLPDAIKRLLPSWDRFNQSYVKLLLEHQEQMIRKLPMILADYIN
jgi:hypothetical protein